MKDIIEINGQKYKKIIEEVSDDIKGQGYVAFVFLYSMILLIVCIIMDEWDSVIICLFFMSICLGLDIAFGDIRNCLDKLSKGK